MSCGTGCGCAPCSSLGGIPYALTQAQIDEVLQRNPAIAARVAEWNLLISTLNWSQVHEAGGLFSFTLNIPGAIPSDGIRFNDAVLGSIIIFPDASGTLHYTGGSDSTAGTPVSTFGLPSLDSLVLLGIIVGGFMLLREVKR